MTERLIALLDPTSPAKAPVGSKAVCSCGTTVTKVKDAVFGPRPKWIHDHPVAACPVVMSIHSITTGRNA